MAWLRKGEAQQGGKRGHESCESRVEMIGESRTHAVMILSVCALVNASESVVDECLAAYPAFHRVHDFDTRDEATSHEFCRVRS